MFALIDMEYILKNIPAYEQANTQLNQASQQYQSEVEAKAKEAETLYKEYQKASAYPVGRTENAKRRSNCGKRKGSSRTEKEIFRSLKENGQKQEALIAPIQDKSMKR